MRSRTKEPNKIGLQSSVREAIIFKHNSAPLLLDCPHQAKWHRPPRLGLLLPPRETRPPQNQIVNQKGTNPTPSCQVQEGCPHAPNLWAMDKKMLHSLSNLLAKRTPTCQGEPSFLELIHSQNFAPPNLPSKKPHFCGNNGVLQHLNKHLMLPPTFQQIKAGLYRIETSLSLNWGL